MSGNDLLMSAAHQRISALEDKTRAMIEVITAHQNMNEHRTKQVELLQEQILDLHGMIKIHSAEIKVLTMALVVLGQFLVSVKALPPQSSDAIASTVSNGLDPDTREQARRVIEMLESWGSFV